MGIDSPRDSPHNRGMAVPELDFAPRSGRRTAPLAVEAVRALGEADLALLASERGTRAPAVKKLRDRHHQLARLMAQGMKVAELSAITGYDPSRISILKGDPSFRELLAQYREVEDGLLGEFTERAAVLTLSAINEIHDRLEDEPESFTVQTLLEVSKTFADRTGHAPVQKNLNLNANVDLGNRLSAARKRLAEVSAGER